MDATRVRGFLARPLSVTAKVALAIATFAFLASAASAGPLNVAHRGGKNIAWPENTIPNFLWGASVGADWLETDVWESSDGVLVLHHDLSMCRTTNIADFPGYDCEVAENNPLGRFPEIRDFDLAFLKTLDVGSWLAPEFAGMQMPTLEEALVALDGTGIPLILDMKTLGQSDRIAQILQDNGISEDQLHAWIRFGRQMAAQWKTALPNAKLLYGYNDPLNVTPEAIAERASLGDFGMVATSPNMTQEFVDLVHSHGLFLLTYPSSTGQLNLDTQIDMGVDAIVQGNPEWFRGYLDELHCWDELDNDGDTLVDFPDDPDCLARSDRSEIPDCRDNIDNDADGFIDWPDDPDCRSAETQSEIWSIPAVGPVGGGILVLCLLALARRQL